MNRSTNLKEKLSWKRCLFKVIASAPILFLLIFIYGIILASVAFPGSLSASGHANGIFQILLGAIVMALILSVFNLVYLLPIDNLKIRFLSPGLTAVVLFILSLFGGNNPAMVFFIGAGLINFLIGYYHYRKSSAVRE